MATERRNSDLRVGAQASVLKRWGQVWRTTHAKSQQDLGRAAGYGSDTSPKSAAVAISRIESGKTEPAGRYRQQLLDALGRTEEELRDATDAVVAGPPRRGPFARVVAGPVHEENASRRASIIAASNALTQRVAFRARTSEQVSERVRDDFVLPFLEYAASVAGLPLIDAAPAPAPVDAATSPVDAGTSHAVDVRKLRDRTRASVVRALTESADDAAAGLRGDAPAGAGVAAGVLAAVSASASVSTSTAIARVSGAAASSATLSWLGGGSLAARSLGLAGGTALLTGIVALPALLALGGVIVWKGRRLRREAEADAEKLDAAQQSLEDMTAAVARAEHGDDAQQDVVQLAGLIGRTIHARLITPGALSDALGEDGRIAWDRLGPYAQEAVQVEISLVSIILDAQALPIWLGVASVGQPDLGEAQEQTAERSDEWIRTSLSLARADLDGYEGWLRGRLELGLPG